MANNPSRKEIHDFTQKNPQIQQWPESNQNLASNKKM